MTEQQQYEKVCKGRFDLIDRKQDETLDLLRGQGSEMGIVALVAQHEKHLIDIHSTLYGTADNRESSLCRTVQRLDLNGTTRKSDEQSRLEFRRAILLRLVTAAIIAVAGLLLSLYAHLYRTPPAVSAEPASSGATHGPSERPSQ